MNTYAKAMVPDTVSMIENFVLDSYSGDFSIVQELVQNASDANADTLIFAYLKDGISAAYHPLLHNPLLIVMNNGPFTEENEEALHRLGIGTKANDQFTIGKFGLGMKSIFHWCDMYFYFTTDGEFQGAINPYIDAFHGGIDTFHEAWNISEEEGEHDAELLRKSVSLVSDVKSTFFCLAIPIRIGGQAGPNIKNTYYDGESLFSLISDSHAKNPESDLISSLVTMLATLSVTSPSKGRKLYRIDFIDTVKLSCILHSQTIEVKKDDKNYLNAVFKAITCSVSEENKEKIAILRSSPSWPRIRKASSEQEQVALFSENSSLILIRIPMQTSQTLSLGFSSYLPLKDESQIINVIGDMQYSYSIILNGSFSIDSGRNRIEGLGDILRHTSDGTYPDSASDFLESVSLLSSQSRVMELWNLVLLRDIILPELPRLFLSEGFQISDEELTKIFNLFRNRNLQPFLELGTKAEYIAHQLQQPSLKYQMQNNHSVVLLPYIAKNSVLLSDERFVSFIEDILVDKSYAFISQNNLIDGFVSERNIKESATEENLVVLFELIAGKYLSALKNDSFRGYIINLINTSFRHVVISEEGAKRIWNAIFRLLSSILDINGIDSIPKNLIELIRNAVSLIKDMGTFYVRAIDIDNDGFFEDAWFETQEILFYPLSRTRDESDRYFGSGIGNIGTYLMKVKERMINFHPEEAGLIFQACVASLDKSRFAAGEYEETLRIVFNAGEKIIPVKCFSSSSFNADSYVSYRDIRYIYSMGTPQDLNNIRILYEYAYELTPIYAITKETSTIYGISYNQLEKMDFSGVAETLLQNYQEHFNREAFEDFFGAITDSTSNQSWIHSPLYNIFPTIDGRYVNASISNSELYVNTFFDCRMDDPYQIQPKSQAYNIVRINNPRNQDKARLFFREQIITSENFLKFYMECSILDAEVIFYYRSNWTNPSVRKHLVDDEWFPANGKLYPCSRIYIDTEISQITKDVLSKEFLAVSEETVLYNTGLHELEEAGLLQIGISGLPLIPVRECYQMASPLLIFRPDGKSKYSPEKIAPHFQSIVAAMCRISDHDSPLYIWGMFLNDAIRNTKNDAVEAYIRWNELIHRQRTNLSGYKGIEELLQILSANNSSTGGAFVFVIQCVSDLHLQLDTEKLKDVEFPAETKKWRKLADLCDRNNYKTADPGYLLNNIIPVSLFKKPLIKQPVLDSVKPISRHTLEELWPTVSKTIIGFVLFISNDEKLRKEALSMHYNIIDDSYYLKPIQSLIRLSGLNHLIHPATVAFDITNSERKRIIFTKEQKGKSIEAISITGNTVMIPVVSDNGGSINPFPVITQRDATTTICHVADFSSATVSVDVRICQALDDLLGRVFFDNARFDKYSISQELALKASRDMQTAQDIVKEQLRDVLNQLGIDKKTDIGQQISGYLNQFDILATRRSEARVNCDFNKQQSIEKAREALQDQIGKAINDDAAFRNYLLSAVRRLMEKVTYEASSVPYEFFQNADDAALQLEDFPNAEAKSFMFSISRKEGKKGDHVENLLIIEHNGRLINSCPPDHTHDEWASDLIHMVSFSSRKQENENVEETGKFGYGFKSCYFITDEPRIYSGSLSTKILGGLFPTYIPPKNDIGDNTRFELPLRDSVSKEAIDYIIDEFRKDVPLLLLFAQEINKIYVNGTEYTRKEVHSEGKYKVTILSNDEAFVEIRENGVNIVFPLNVEHKSLKSATSTKHIWCTAPLKLSTSSSVGYYLNSRNFAIDIGRTQFAVQSQRNKILVSETIAPLMKSFLLDAYRGNLPSGISEYITQGSKLASDVISRIEAGYDTDVYGPIFKHAYIDGLVNEEHVVYTGSSIEAITPQTTYILIETTLGSKYKTVAELISKVDELIKTHTGNGDYVIISRSLYAPSDKIIRIGRIEDLIDFLAGIEPKLSPETAMLACSLLDSCNSSGYSFEKFLFRTIEGHYINKDKLIWSDLSPDLFSIAPNLYKAIQEYPDVLADTCKISDITISGWIKSAETSAERISSLHVIAARGAILLHLIDADPSLWVKREWERYKNSLSLDEISLFQRYFMESPKSSILNFQGEDYLEAVYCAWEEKTTAEQNEAIQRYRDEVFGVRKLDLSSFSSADWYRLLYTTALKSLGRVNSRQNKEFVSRFMESIHWEKKPEDNVEEWFEHILRWPAGKGGQYEEWRKYLPVFAQISYAADVLYEIFTHVPAHDYFEQLDYRNLPENQDLNLEGSDFKHSFGKYYPLILLELLNNGLELPNECRESMIRECFFAPCSVRAKLNIASDANQNINFRTLVCEYIEQHPQYERYKSQGGYPFYCFENDYDLYEENDD